MKTQQKWFDEYAESHQNLINQRIHFICVPLIYLSILGMLMTIPNDYLTNSFNLEVPALENWATVLLIIVHIFYLRLSFSVFLKMLIFSVVCLFICQYLSQFVELFYTSLSIFVLAWIGQFIGHNIEGKKPSFFKDLQFLLIGPAWVFEKIFKK